MTNPIPQFDSYKVNDETKANRFSGLRRMKMGHTSSQVDYSPIVFSQANKAKIQIL